MTLKDPGKENTLTALLANTKQEEKRKKMMSADLKNFWYNAEWALSRKEAELIEQRKSSKISSEEAKAQIQKIKEWQKKLQEEKPMYMKAPISYADTKEIWDKKVKPVVESGGNFVSNVKTLDDAAIMNSGKKTINWRDRDTWSIMTGEFLNLFYLPYEHNGVAAAQSEQAAAQQQATPQGQNNVAPGQNNAPTPQWNVWGWQRTGRVQNWAQGWNQKWTTPETPKEENWKYDHITGTDLDDTIPYRFQTSNDPNVQDMYDKLKAMPIKERQAAINSMNLSDAKGKISETITSEDIDKFKISHAYTDWMSFDQIKAGIIQDRANEYWKSRENTDYETNARKAWVDSILQPSRAELLKKIADRELVNDNLKKDPGMAAKELWINTTFSAEERKYMDDYKADINANRLASRLNVQLHEWHNTTDNARKMEIKRQMLQTASDITDKNVYNSIHGGQLLPFLRGLGLWTQDDKSVESFKVDKNGTTGSGTDTSKWNKTGTQDTTKTTVNWTPASNDPTQKSTEPAKDATGTTEVNPKLAYSEEDQEEDILKQPNRADYKTEEEYNQKMQEYNWQLEDQTRQYRAVWMEWQGKQIQKYRIWKNANGQVETKEAIGQARLIWVAKSHADYLQQQEAYKKTNTPVDQTNRENPQEMINNRAIADANANTDIKQENSKNF